MQPTINFPEVFPTLQTDRLVLSTHVPEDASAFYKLRSDSDFMKYLGQFPMQDFAEAEKRIASDIKSFTEKTGISWRISTKEGSEMIGYIGFWRIDFYNSRAEIGFGISTNEQGKGYMSEALKATVEFAFKELDVHSILADVDPRNTACVQLLKKAGFLKEAHFRENFYFNGEFLDSDQYCMLKSDLSL